MRVIGLVLLLFSAAIAGCLGGAGTDDGTNPNWNDLAVPAGQYESHPAYGFPTNGMLPVATGSDHRVVKADGTVQWYRPEGKPLPDAVAGLQPVAHVDGTNTGGGIAVLGPLAFIGGRTQGPLHVVDISDPRTPRIVGTSPDVPVRDADTILFPDGRLIVITTAGGRDQFATDVTDPTDPRLVGTINTDHGNHNLAVVPGTPIVYNSGSGGIIDIVDYSDPSEPRAVGSFQNDHNCHDITFHIDRANARYRAYCAGYPETQIWDIADPLDPQMVARIPYPSVEQGTPQVGGLLPDLDTAFPLSFSHLAMVNHDATVLIVGDETGGGAINGCDTYVEAGGIASSGPLGNLWFYDLSDETAPVLHGHVSPAFQDAVGGSCTAHFGRLIEDTGTLAMGFYAAGVVLVDFTDISNPRITARLDQGGSIWDVWYHQGYLFTGDMSRGMDVIAVV